MRHTIKKRLHAGSMQNYTDRMHNRAMQFGPTKLADITTHNDTIGLLNAMLSKQLTCTLNIFHNRTAFNNRINLTIEQTTTKTPAQL